MAESHHKSEIEIIGARVNNLKNVNVSIPKDQLVVITGLSGSGKSSLAFDTLYAEGQRRYVESLSAYTRQFLGRINKPDVDSIKGIPPAIAIEQKVNTVNPRSTVGTTTEIYDYLRLLYARAGKTISPVSGREVKKHSASDVVDFIIAKPTDAKFLLVCRFVFDKVSFEMQYNELVKEGFTRLFINKKVEKISELKPASLKNKEVLLIIDRVIVAHDEDALSRFADSSQTALKLGNGSCGLIDTDNDEERWFSKRFEEDGILFEEPNEHMFSFNSPLGACPVCEGYGKILGIDEDLVIPDKRLSLYSDAIACFRGETMQNWKNEMISALSSLNFPIHKPYRELSNEQISTLWKGVRGFSGINGFFNYLEEKKYKIQYRVMIARYRGKTTCSECGGARLKKQALYVKFRDKVFSDLLDMPIRDLMDFFKKIELDVYELKVAGRLMLEINNRLRFLYQVGLGYLTLNRLSASLSGGESQRINLATSLGSSLVGSLYILDEPSIGLHSRDTQLLIEVLKELKKLGNTVVVVEHDEEIMRASDFIVDIGPLAGRLGGEVVYAGPSDKIAAADTLTSAYLSGKLSIEKPTTRRKWNNYIELLGANENNLKNISVRIPLYCITAVSGVSGSGKSTLVKGILYPTINRILNNTGPKSGKIDEIKGDITLIKGIEFVDQNPIGKSSRSNPVTYIKAYDEIRKLYSKESYSMKMNFEPSSFSFNVEGGRCEECQGEGEIKVEMQFMADVKLLCDACKGKRFKDEVLDVKFHGKSIFDILEFTVDEAIAFFTKHTGNLQIKVVDKLQSLADVGLGYIKLGQSSSTLSGGENQRVKLATFLSRDSKHDHTLFIFDEPTTGLHFHDIKKLMAAFDALVKKGHSLVIIEHNLEVIKCADWIIDLGPEGGDEGGFIVCEGTPETIANCEKSYTGKYLKEKL